MKSSLRKQSIILAAIALATAACSEQLIAPTPDSVVRANVLPASSIIVYKHKKPVSEIDARASYVGATGWTFVEVTTGTFAHFDPNTGEIVGGAPANSFLRKVHVKYCKDYKSLGLKQFSANFEYKANDGDKDDIDKNPDDEPDSPLDPADKTNPKQPVNWDRSRRFLTLDGSGYVKIPFTGIPNNVNGQDVLLELHVLYVTPTVKADGKIELKKYEVKFCIPVDPGPDLGFTSSIGGSQGNTSGPTNFGYIIDVVNGTDLLTTATCAVYVDDVLYARSAQILISAAVSRECKFGIQFATGGQHTLRFEIENVQPGDFDPTNNSASRLVQVADLASGIVTVRLNPTIIENVVTSVSNDTLYFPSRENATTKSAFLSQTSQTFDQSSTLTVNLDRQFDFPIILGLSQVSNDDGVDRVIHSGTIQVNGCVPGPQQSALLPISFAVTYCNNNDGTASMTYRTNAKANLNQNGFYNILAGTFVPYGTAITYNMQLTSGARVYTTTLTVPIRTDVTNTQLSSCETVATNGQVCHYGTVTASRRDGSASFSVSLPPGT